VCLRTSATPRGRHARLCWIRASRRGTCSSTCSSRIGSCHLIYAEYADGDSFADDPGFGYLDTEGKRNVPCG
jgi:hypothetical protein